MSSFLSSQQNTQNNRITVLTNTEISRFKLLGSFDVCCVVWCLVNMWLSRRWCIIVVLLTNDGDSGVCNTRWARGPGPQPLWPLKCLIFKKIIQQSVITRDYVSSTMYSHCMSVVSLIEINISVGLITA